MKVGVVLPVSLQAPENPDCQRVISLESHQLKHGSALAIYVCLTILRFDQFLNQTVIGFKLAVSCIVRVRNDELDDLRKKGSSSEHDCNSRLVSIKPRHVSPFFFRAPFSAVSCFSFASRLSNSSFDTVSTCRTALSNRSNSVSPETGGAGKGFMCHYGTPAGKSGLQNQKSNCNVQRAHNLVYWDNSIPQGVASCSKRSR